MNKLFKIVQFINFYLIVNIIKRSYTKDNAMIYFFYFIAAV